MANEKIRTEMKGTSGRSLRRAGAKRYANKKRRTEDRAEESENDLAQPSTEPSAESLEEMPGERQARLDKEVEQLLAEMPQETLIAEKLYEVRDILWNDWDPIGTKSMGGPPDEYDSYAPDILRKLLSGCTLEELDSHLEQVEVFLMGMKPGPYEPRKTAVANLFGVLQEPFSAEEMALALAP